MPGSTSTRRPLPVVLGERGRRLPAPDAPAQRRPEQVGGCCAPPGPRRCGSAGAVPSPAGSRPGGDQPVGAQVVAAGASRSTSPRSSNCITAIAVMVLVIEAIRKTVSSVDGRARADVGDAVPVEPRQGSVADHPHRQAGGRPAVEDLADPGRQLSSSIDAVIPGHPSVPWRQTRFMAIERPRRVQVRPISAEPAAGHRGDAGRAANGTDVWPGRCGCD